MRWAFTWLSQSLHIPTLQSICSAFFCTRLGFVLVCSIICSFFTPSWMALENSCKTWLIGGAKEKPGLWNFWSCKLKSVRKVNCQKPRKFMLQWNRKCGLKNWEVSANFSIENILGRNLVTKSHKTPSGVYSALIFYLKIII